MTTVAGRRRRPAERGTEGPGTEPWCDPASPPPPAYPPAAAREGGYDSGLQSQRTGLTSRERYSRAGTHQWCDPTPPPPPPASPPPPPARAPTHTGTAVSPSRQRLDVVRGSSAVWAAVRPDNQGGYPVEPVRYGHTGRGSPPLARAEIQTKPNPPSGAKRARWCGAGGPWFMRRTACGRNATAARG